MLELTERQRALQLPRLLADIVNTTSTDVMLLDNIEVLFDVSLKQDPLRICRDSRGTRRWSRHGVAPSKISTWSTRRRTILNTDDIHYEDFLVVTRRQIA